MSTTEPTVRVGTEFRALRADCNVLWRVTKRRSTFEGGVWEAEAVNEPMEIGGKMYDSDYAFEVDVFSEDQILGTLRMAQMFADVQDSRLAWWAKQTVGSIVHYDAGHLRYVRGEVVLDVDGTHKMRMTGIVDHRWVQGTPGGWQEFDLPGRYLDGSERRSHWVDDVHAGKLLQPHVGDMYEGRLETGHKRVAALDPRPLPLIDLGIPEMTDAEKRQAAQYELRNKLKGLLDDDDQPIETRLLSTHVLLRDNLNIVEVR